MFSRLRETCGSELDARSYEDCDRLVVNRAEPWIQNYHFGELCSQDIKEPRSHPRRRAGSRPNFSGSGSKELERGRRPCFPANRAITN